MIVGAHDSAFTSLYKREYWKTVYNKQSRMRSPKNTRYHEQMFKLWLNIQAICGIPCYADVATENGFVNRRAQREQMKQTYHSHWTDRHAAHTGTTLLSCNYMEDLIFREVTGNGSMCDGPRWRASLHASIVSIHNRSHYLRGNFNRIRDQRVPQDESECLRGIVPYLHVAKLRDLLCPNFTSVKTSSSCANLCKWGGTLLRFGELYIWSFQYKM